MKLSKQQDFIVCNDSVNRQSMLKLQRKHQDMRL